MHPKGRWPAGFVALLTVAALVAACGNEEPLDDSSSDNLAAGESGTVPADPQRQGDAKRGYDYLVNGAYIRTGVPYSAYKKLSFVADWVGNGAGNVPGRSGRNAELPYFLTAYTTKKGVELVVPNCLLCHGGKMNGETIVGLGNNDLPFQLPDVLAGQLTKALASVGPLFLTADEQEELDRFKSRFLATSGVTQTKVQGTNPADSIPAASAAYRDPVTLHWRESADSRIVPDADPVPLNVPPWWRVGKKNALYYVAEQARGDHARLMMSAAIYSTDDVETAEEIDRGFVDVRAYLASLQAPKYPLPIDELKAKQGESVFRASCASCHGQGGRYPNKWISVERVGTDPMHARRATDEKARSFIDWYSKSWYGSGGLTKLTPKYGYAAPPLDGIWATAPFFHNGSVPTLEGVLDSTKRPQFWTWSFESRDYDVARMGLPFEVVDHSQADEWLPWRRGKLYDTTLEGYSNAGHTYGDRLSAEDRAAVLEYMKTL